MQVAIDIGNTRAKIGFFEGREMLNFSYLRHEEVADKLLHLKEDNIPRILSSTKNLSLIGIEDEHLNDVIVLSAQIDLPININYETPQTLGNDRIANVVAAVKLYPNQNLLIIDAGTCITYDFVDENNVFLGGNISPGLHLRLKAMNAYTDKLPLIDLKEDYDFIGKSTEEALNNGVWNGCVGEMDYYCGTFLENFNNTAIILTGGDTEIFGKALKNSIFANPFLTLTGLNEILLYNRT